MAKKFKTKRKPTKKRPNDFLIAIYQNTTQKISEIKKRHWIFLMALAASHLFLVANGQTVLRNGTVAWDGNLIWAHVGIALFLGLMMWHGSYALRCMRCKLKSCYNDLLSRDPGLNTLLTCDPREDSRSDILMYLSAIYAPLFSIAVILQNVDADWMIKIVCMGAAFQLLDIIFQKSPKLKPPPYFAVSLAVLVVEVWYIYLLSN